MTEKLTSDTLSLNDSTRKDDKEFLVRCLKGMEPEFNADAAADYILDGLLGCGDTEPVSVSLEKGARAIDRNAFEYEGQEVEHAGDKARRSRARMQAKAAAEAWGLPYVD